MTKGKIHYTVSTGGKWIKKGSAISNFISFKCPKASVRYLKARPKRQQVDVRGIDARGRRVRSCWKYWDGNRVKTQRVKPINGLR